MKDRDFLLKGVLLRQVYAWVKAEMIPTLKDFRTFEKDLNADNPQEAFEPILEWLHSTDPDTKPVLSWIKQQQCCALPLFGAYFYFVEIKEGFQALFKDPSKEWEYTKLALVDLSIMVGIGMAKTVTGPRPDTKLSIIFEYFAFLKDNYSDLGGKPLASIIDFFRKNKKARSIANVVEILARESDESGEFKTYPTRTWQTIRSGQKVHFTSLLELAEKITSKKEDRILVTTLLLVAHAFQYELSRQHGEKVPPQPIWLKYLFELEGLWKNDSAAAMQRTEQFLSGSRMRPEWQENAIAFVGKLFQEGNKQLVFQENPLFPNSEKDGFWENFTEVFLILFPRSALASFFGLKVEKEESPSE